MDHRPLARSLRDSDDASIPWCQSCQSGHTSRSRTNGMHTQSSFAFSSQQVHIRTRSLLFVTLQNPIEFTSVYRTYHEKRDGNDAQLRFEDSNCEILIQALCTHRRVTIQPSGSREHTGARQHGSQQPGTGVSQSRALQKAIVCIRPPLARY